MRPSQILILLFCILPIWAFASIRIIYTVNTIDDSDDGVCNTAHCSLREAINATNNDGLPNGIHFDIPGTAPHIILPSATLPSIIENNTTIDASTQTNWNIGDIIIDGSNAPAGFGLRITACYTTILGLKIQAFSTHGILLEGGEYNTIGENGKGNIIVGNGNHGVQTLGGNYSTIQYNYIGVDGLTYAMSGNVWSGIRLQDANYFQISNNVIGGNTKKGIFVTNGTYFDIENNKVGGIIPDKIFGDGQSAVQINDSNYFNLTDNFVGNSGVFGINISDSETFDLSNNTVGYINATGTIDMGNVKSGIRCLRSSNFNILDNLCISNQQASIKVSESRNATLSKNQVIEGNQHGILIINHELDLVIERNIVGTNNLGTQDLGNTLDGIELRSSTYTGMNKNIIVRDNLIAYNKRNGIMINEEIASLSRNKIYCNDVKEIENSFSITSNIKVVPIITNVSNIISGTAEPNDYIELFKLEDFTPCTNCGGKVYLNSTTANSNGDWTMPLPLELKNGDDITVTATGTFSTSEFSNCVEIDLIPCEFRPPYVECLTVNTDDDTDDGICDATHCSLREAINAANLSNNQSVITFLGVPDTIVLSSALPCIIADSTIIDGIGGNRVVINGVNISTGDGICIIDANNCEVNSISVINFPNNGIDLNGTKDCAITNNVIGGNGEDGIYFKSDTASVIYGNSVGIVEGPQAIYLFTIPECVDDTHSDTTALEIVSPVSYKDIGNGKRGIFLFQCLQNIVDSNLVCYNAMNGIHANYSEEFRFSRNNIGTDGYQPLSNDKHGIQIQQSNNYEVIKNNSGFNGLNGIRMFESSFGVVDSNVAHSNKNHGIFALDHVNQLSISHNLVGIDYLNTKLKNEKNGIKIRRNTQPIGDKNITINNNTISNNIYAGIKVEEEIVYINNNQIYCNTELGIKMVNTQVKPAPIIVSINENINGTTAPLDLVEVYYSNIKECGQSSCQGEIFIGYTAADALGNWSLPAPPDMNAGKVVTATATETGVGTSQFAVCYTVSPDICAYAKSIPLNKDACVPVGIVQNMNLLTDGSDMPLSSCQNTYMGKDAWFKVVVPNTGNLLIRTNTNNRIVPVIEAYKGKCGMLSLAPNSECGILESVPYAIIFENYSFQDTIYLRVWDKNNTVINSSSDPILHLSAYELPTDKSGWFLCDKNSNSLNPTQISQREATRFLLEYTDAASQTAVNADRDALIMEGASLVDSFICDAVKLELWSSSDPIQLETRRLSAKSKASVDTTNYNYLFESREFQVNSYAVGIQSNATTSMDKDGNFVMIWRDTERGHNYGRLYNSSGNPITAEFEVGATDRSQYNSSVVMKTDGSFIVVWYEIDPTFSEGIATVLGRQFDAQGVPVSAPFEISVAAAAVLPSSTTEEIEFKETVQIGTNPQIGVDNNGNYIVVWNAGFNIFAQKFDANNNLQGSLIQIGEGFRNLCSPMASIAMNNNGDFVMAWVAYEGSDYAGDTNILVQRYDNTGMNVGNSIVINSQLAGLQSAPDIVMANDGSFIASWESRDLQGVSFNYNVYARRFGSNGQALAPEFLVNTYTEDNQYASSISLFDDGRYAIAWTSEGQDGNKEGVFAKLFDNNDNPIPTGVVDNISENGVGNEFRMNNFTNPEQKNPQLANDGSSILLSAWEDGGNELSNVEGETSLGIFGQRYELIGLGANTIFYPIGTATPSKLLGDTLLYPNIAYAPSNVGKAVKVATIDTGIDRFHPFLTNAIWKNPELNDSDNCQTGDIYGYNFASESADVTDIDGHGTGVNGIIARDFDSNIELELMNLKFHEANRGNVFDAVCSIYYAVDNGAEVLNLSWGFEANETPNILYKALQYAQDNDLIIITSAGNTSKNNDNINKYPANFDLSNMIVVTAYSISNDDGTIELANYASYGLTTVDIAAPSFYEVPLFNTGMKTLSAGTSLAAPLVARTAAIIKGKYPNLTAAEIIDCILSSAQSVSNLSDKVLTGGILDHNAALACAKSKAGPELAIRVFLQGTFTGMNMTNHLPPLGTFPMSEPYTALGSYGILNNTSTSTTQEILTSKSIVDWILVELRNANNSVISKRAALLDKDGYILDATSGECLFFPEAVLGNSYHIVVRHRNHLGIMTATQVQLN